MPRYYYQSPTKNWTKELVLFYDASEDACAATAYMRAVSTVGEIVCHLVMPNTHATEDLSVPRGELMGSQLAKRPAKFVRRNEGHLWGGPHC